MLTEKLIFVSLFTAVAPKNPGIKKGKLSPALVAQTEARAGRRLF